MKEDFSMKKYTKPEFYVTEFAPNEYVSACGDGTGKPDNWKSTCIHCGGSVTTTSSPGNIYPGNSGNSYFDGQVQMPDGNYSRVFDGCYNRTNPDGSKDEGSDVIWDGCEYGAAEGQVAQNHHHMTAWEPNRS